MMNICIILGTRPEIIKMSSVIRECRARAIPYFILHTGQHYDYEMDKIFFEELELPSQSVNLDVGSGSHGQVTGKILIEVEKILQRKNPDVVLVQGDTNTVLAGALAAAKLHIPIGHIEAGLRSYDRNQPEEYNRIIADHISTYLFAPTRRAKENLTKEGIGKKFSQQIYVTGNTIVDAVLQSIKIAKHKSSILNVLHLEEKQYIVGTIHREENVDNKERLENLLKGFNLVISDFNLPFVLPLHPRTKKTIHDFNLEKNIDKITVVSPLGYLDFIQLEAQSSLVLSDSGGIIEESCILNIPSVSLREHSDRPEVISIGASVLSGVYPDSILKMAHKMIRKVKNWKQPFGDGKAGKKIIDLLVKNEELL